MTGAVELFLADGKPSGIWYCSECRSVYNDRLVAQTCHGVTHCEHCKRELGKRQPYYRRLCERCDALIHRAEQVKKEYERYAKANKVRASEYDGQQVFFNDKYYETVEDAVDGCGHPPEYVWAAKNIGLRKADVGDLLERVLEEAWDGADSDDLCGVDKLSAAVDVFNDENAHIPVYMVDYDTALVLDEKAFAEWQKESEIDQ